MKLLNWFFPSLCLGCEAVLERKESYYCLSCKDSLRIDLSSCFPLEHSYCLTPVLKKLIHHGKYKQKMGIFHHLVKEQLPDWTFNENRLYLPVPLHPARQRERGFNQAELLANALAETLGGEVLLDAFSRKKFIKSQTKLGKLERQKNVSQAFHLSKSIDFSQKEIVIVDDIYTTGATIEVLQSLLPRNISARVWTLAKTMTGDEFSDWEWEQMDLSQS